jgi:UDPglucose--hexose-1-phosphate uridylyltransferase
MLDFSKYPHRRFNPLLGDWVLVSPHRTQRPWQGRVEQASQAPDVAYDPSCYLCPGNSRAAGKRNPPYSSTFVFDNDFPALLPDAPEQEHDDSGLVVARTERGVCRVVCFSPRHDLTVARMSLPELRTVVDVWVGQYQELGATDWINHVEMFENRGAIMGASNPHPHCQIWANANLPNLPAREQEAQRKYREAHGRCLLCDYVSTEGKLNDRSVCANEHFVALVPFWAVWPFEAIVVPRRHITGMDEITTTERDGLADVLKRLTTRYDNLFEISFPYSMGFHQRPTDRQHHPEWHLHAHFFPPLLRSATVQKFMVGYELLATPQRDITAESAAERLRSLSEVHYRERG